MKRKMKRLKRNRKGERKTEITERGRYEDG